MLASDHPAARGRSKTMETKSQATTILVVDDERAYLQAVADVLHSRGYGVLKAGSAAEALEVLDVVTPELILLDVMMPEVDGLTLLRQLSDDPRFLGVPIVMATAKTMPADRWSAWERGASAYLPKPFTYQEVTSLVEYLLVPPEPVGAPVNLVDRLAAI
jgi:DNA-binding response OmpR family regulator